MFISKNTAKDCILIRKLFESGNVVLINIVAILMILAKWAALGRLKIKVF